MDALTLGNTRKLIFKYGRVLFRSLPLIWHTAPRETSFVALTLLLESLIPAVGIWINKQVVDHVALGLSSKSSYDLRLMLGLVAGWGLAVFLENLLPPWSEAATVNLEEQLTAKIGLLLIQKTNSFADLLRFEDSQFYDELQILKEEFAREPMNLLMVVSQVTRQSLIILSMMVLLVPVGWWLPLLILIASLPQTYASFKARWQLWETQSKKSPQARRMQYYSTILLTDTYAKEVRLFGLGQFFSQRYLEAFRDKYLSLRYLRGKQALWLTVLAIFGSAGNGFAFFWIVLQAFQGRISPGNVLLFIQALSYTQQSILMLIHSGAVLQRASLFMERLFTFLDSPPTMKLPAPATPLDSKLHLGITFEQVSFAYPDGRVALSEVSFHINPGETVALVGENGAGKTTLVKLLARLYDPTAGKIIIDGQNLNKLELAAWRQHIGVVFQDFCHYSLSIAENIALGDLAALGDRQRLEQAIEKAGIADLSRFPQGLDTPLGKQFSGTELSGGEWQKIALARAFIRQETAQVLILDEPTAALDPRSESEVYSRFAQLVHGKTAILVTHRLASVKMCDRILVLKAGKLLEVGTHQELLSQKGEYASLWQLQARQYGEE
jgi:ATP-binding cassette, subfamily B, bacterial